MPEDGPSNPDTIKAVMADLPQLLAALVRLAVDAEQDMAIVAEIPSADAVAAAAAMPADVIITATPDGELAPPLRAALLGRRPIPVVVISIDGTCIDVYGRSSARGYGIHGLVDLIREAVIASRPRYGS